MGKLAFSALTAFVLAGGTAHAASRTHGAATHSPARSAVAAKATANYRPGSNSLPVNKIPGHYKLTDITMKRGVAGRIAGW
jgi:hypothetical protein